MSGMRSETTATPGGFAFIYEQDVPVAMSDGLVLRANVFRPAASGRYPVVMAQGCYGKDVHFADAYKAQWAVLKTLYPGIDSEGTSGRFLRWELPDPERFVSEGFVVVALDARGSGRSPGYMDPFGAREIRDYAEAIEWAGAQDWSNGRVGLLGVSYLAISQWLVAALRPQHLAAIVPWEGASDHYRDWSRHGGILSDGFVKAWIPRQCTENQHGNAASSYRDRDTGERTTGPSLDDAMLAGNRADYVGELIRHRLDDAWHRERTPVLENIEVPVLSVGNWGGPGLHLRGNVEGYLRAGSREKHLSMHIGTHYESFYLPRYVAMQKRFFDRHLKGIDNGFDREPPVRLEVRDVRGGASVRHEGEWPPTRTRYAELHLDAQAMVLSEAPARESSVRFDARAGEVSFSHTFAHDSEITGHMRLLLRASSSTPDMDVFATLHVLSPQGEELRFTGAHEPTPLTRGWLRASQRRVDPARSTPLRPWHPHDGEEKLTPGEPCDLDIEIWPTSIVVPAGWTLKLTLAGRDFEFPGLAGRILHDDAHDRGGPDFSGTTTIYCGGENGSRLVVPVV